SNSVRFSAATLAIRIAANTCEDTVAHNAYLVGKIMAARLDHPVERTDELDMLYQTSFGDCTIGIEAARRMLRTSYTIHGTTERLSRQLRVAFALKVCGDIAGSKALLEKVHAESVKEHLASTFSFASWRLSSIHLDLDDIIEAERWFGEYQRIAPVDREPLAGVIVNNHSVRIALVRGDLVRAEYHFLRGQESMLESGHLIRLAHSMATQLGIARLRADIAEVAKVVDIARPIFKKVQSSIGQSFFASEIALSLATLGLLEEATCTANEYVRVRREQSPLPNYFTKRLEVFGIVIRQRT
ncbi:MAG: hypothetical protein ABJB66_10605, partial [Gemmatimonadaceae bacterium]